MTPSFILRKLKMPSVLTIGVFDGVHLGHQKLLDFAREIASKNELPLLVLTFEPHPEEVLFEKKKFLLTEIKEKERRIIRRNVDGLLIINFDSQVSRYSPHKFVQELLSLSPKFMVVGESFRFGKGRKGDVRFLKEEGKKQGFEVFSLPLVKVDGEIVSSSRIRELIWEGKIELANKLLGESFHLEGEVVRGEGIAFRELGVPTANLSVSKRLIRPRYGVYAGKASLKGEKFPAIIYVGVSPTFSLREEAIEVYLPDFKGDLSGERMRIDFLRFIREERKFDTPHDLKNQVRKDIEKAKMILASL
jgi:riboflavin kinase/FMN adenylyltransferase